MNLEVKHSKLSMFVTFLCILWLFVFLVNCIYPARAAQFSGHSQRDRLAKQRAWHSTLQPSEASTYGMECNRIKPSSKQNSDHCRTWTRDALQHCRVHIFWFPCRACLFECEYYLKDAWKIPTCQLLLAVKSALTSWSDFALIEHLSWKRVISGCRREALQNPCYCQEQDSCIKRGTPFTWLTPLCLLFCTSSKVLEGGLSWVDVYIPHIQPMSSFSGIFRNTMMSLAVLIYSRCGRCCSPQCSVVGEGLEDSLIRSGSMGVL